MNPLLEWTVVLLLLIGSFFLLVGSVGLARLPDFFTRLHGPTKASTLGIGAVLVASTLYFSFEQHGLRIKDLVIALFLFITAPITAHMLAKSAMHLEQPLLERTRNQGLVKPAKKREEPTPE